MNPRIWLKGLGIIASMVALGFLARWVGLDDMLNEGWIDDQIRGRGLAGEAVFVGMAALGTAVGLPRQLMAFLAGYAFGLVLGTGLALLATVFGCMITFYYARLIGRGYVREHFQRRVMRVDNFLKDNPFSMTLLIRLLPAGSNLVTNLAAGVSSVPALPFFSGSALGYIPQMVVFALIGSGVTLEQELQIGLGIVLFVISGLLGVHLYRKYRHGKTIGHQIDAEIGADDEATDDGSQAETTVKPAAAKADKSA